VGKSGVLEHKSVKIEEKLQRRAYRKSSTLFGFFGSPPYFYFRFHIYGHRDCRFCLIFARTAQQSVLDGTNGLTSSKPCAYCRIVLSGASRGNLCDSTAFLLILTSGRSGAQKVCTMCTDQSASHALGA